VEEEKLAVEKRKQAAEQLKAVREKSAENTMTSEDADVLDSLLEQLRNGNPVPRKARRARASIDSRLDAQVPSDVVDDPANKAKGLLAQLQSSGFEAFLPPTPTVPNAPRRARRRRPGLTLEEELMSPTSPASSSNELPVFENDLLGTSEEDKTE
jgi:cytokinesis protein